MITDLAVLVYFRTVHACTIPCQGSHFVFIKLCRPIGAIEEDLLCLLKGEITCYDPLKGYNSCMTCLISRIQVIPAEPVRV